MLNESGCHLDETQVLHTLLDMVSCHLMQGSCPTLILSQCSNNVIQAKVSSEQSESGEWVKLVEFSEQEHKPLVDLSDRILETAELGRRAGDMDRVESLSTEFQTKVCIIIQRTRTEKVGTNMAYYVYSTWHSSLAAYRPCRMMRKQWMTMHKCLLENKKGYLRHFFCLCSILWSLLTAGWRFLVEAMPAVD